MDEERPQSPFPGDGNHQRNSQGKDEEPLLVTNERGDDSATTDDSSVDYAAVAYSEIFQFASRFDLVLFTIGIIAAICQGLLLPICCIIYGSTSEKLIANFTFTGLDPNDPIVKAAIDQWEDDMIDKCVQFAIIGAFSWILGYIQVSMVTLGGQNLVHNLKKEAYKCFLRQDMEWYDSHPSGELQNRLIEDLEKIRLGVSDKIAVAAQNVATFLGGIFVGFLYSWKLAAVVCCGMPLIVVSGAWQKYVISDMQTKEQHSYAVAGGIAQETFSSIRTVTAFCKQDYHLSKYADRLKVSKIYGIRKSVMFGLSLGLLYGFVFSFYGLAVWYGPRLIADDEIDVAEMMTSLTSIMTAALALGQAFPGLNDIVICKGAAAFLLSVIKRQPKIDSFDEGGFKPITTKGVISFHNVSFAYPSRENVPVLKNVNIAVNQGETVALVGHSGCGKSTIMSLVQRFYNQTTGEIRLDGRRLESYNLRWLRDRIGVVSQEPVLFGYTIAENIGFGKPFATRDEVIAAARMANAHSFILSFTHSYDTLVGEQGAQLSGGQKQRIAIARALIRNPAILLLDEATSALDTESEKVVQDALDKASAGRTTIVIAHRLSTIKNATKIIAFDKGEIVEEGTHAELMALDGVYARLVRQQSVKTIEDYEEEEECWVAERKRKLIKSARRKKSVSAESISSFNDAATSLTNLSKDDKEPQLPTFTTLLRLNRDEWHWILLGCIFSITATGCFPIYGIFFGDLMELLQKPEDEMLHDRVLISWLFVIFGVILAVGFVLEFTFLGISGEKLTERLRYQMFQTIVTQDIEFFDEPENSTGALTGKLAEDASIIQSATGVRLKNIVEAFAALAVGMVIAFVYSWELALLVVATIPLLIISGGIQAALSTGLTTGDRNDTEKGGKLVVESLTNIRTVQSLGLERQFYWDYVDIVDPLHRKYSRLSHISGVAVGFALSMTYFLYAASFRLSVHLIINGDMEQENSIVVIYALLFAAMSIGQSSSYLPEFSKAQFAAQRVFYQLASKSVINTDSRSSLPANLIRGHIQFQDIRFAYPERRRQMILRGLNLTVHAGTRCALVGYSGCGKSTLMQLLLRFYDPVEGRVLLDGTDIKDFSLHSLRSVMAIVSQEPTLIQGSIFENIAYGLEDPSLATMLAVKDAAMKANIANFIENLPLKYDTQVGEKGTQLSGGQKQRLAIARALIRDPKILLLDEATSALDTESERLVQEALETAQEGRTCLIIAHRLSTVQSCDQIAVIDDGKVREQGTHSELLLRDGIYAKLCNQQSLRT